MGMITDRWSQRDTVVVSTTPYEITQNGTYLVDANGAAITINLLNVASIDGMYVTVKKIDASNNTVTVDAYTTQTIDGSETQVIRRQNVSITIVSRSGNWYIE